MVNAVKKFKSHINELSYLQLYQRTISTKKFEDITKLNEEFKTIINYSKPEVKNIDLINCDPNKVIPELKEIMI